MSDSRRDRPRHLSAVPDLEADDALFERPVVPEPPAAELSPITVADLRQTLVDAGAPDELLAAVDSFGDNLPALAAWLDEQGIGQSPEELVDDLLVEWEPLLERGITALDAEMSGYEFLWLLRSAAGRDDIDEPLIGLLSTAASSARPEALALARVLAYIGSEPVRRAAADAARELKGSGLKDRPWVRDLRAPQFVSAFGYGNPDEGQVSVAVAFRYGKRTHACVTLIDENLGGGFKDIWLGEDADDIHQQFRMSIELSGLTFTDYTAGEAAAILRKAASCEPCPEMEDQIEDVGTYLPLLMRRLELLPG